MYNGDEAISISVIIVEKAAARPGYWKAGSTYPLANDNQAQYLLISNKM